MPSPSTTKTRRRQQAARRKPSVDPALDSPTFEILGALNVHNSVTAFDARLDSFEIDLARMAGSRDDDSRRIAGELAVMKARVEDALAAFAATADEIRASIKGKGAVKASASDVRSLREHVDAQIAGATAGIGDVLTAVATEVQGRLEQLDERITSIGDGIAEMRATLTAVESLAERVEALEAR